VFHERTELPYALGKQTAQKQKELQVYQNKYLPGFDGIFLISNKLMNYMAAFNSNTQKLLTVVDPTFFSTNVPSPYPFPYIGYCGTISGNKDGVPILIEAFAQIAPQFPELKLVLVGNNNKAAIQDTLAAIDKFQLENRIVFTGLIERDMMPVILCNAQILVVAKPDNEQNSGNFPIKIGEYLATGVPIVVTSVGEIPLFINDGESGYLAQPGSATAFAIKMTQALSHPDAAKEAGQRGKAIALNQFHYQIQARVMADYIAQKLKL
jgi:glycosyltransferase involved in cell wall biosynthesis